MTAAVLSMTDADYTPRYSSDHVLGGMVHDYLKVELADPAMRWLIPRCQEASMYPARHPLMEMRKPRPGRDHECSACVSFRSSGRIEGRL